MQKTALYTSAVVYASAGAIHFGRLFTRTEIVVSGEAAPLWISLPAGVFLAALAAWMVVAARRT